MTEERKDVRFEEIGRVDAPDLCALPGVLSDISETALGFKSIHSPGMKQLESYIHLLDEEKSKNSEFEIENPEYSFI
mgnify:CR=1 FL=1